MKTKLQIFSIALLGFILTSCSSSMYMSKSSTTSADDIYYTPNKTTTLVASEKVQTTNPNNVSLQNTSKFSQLENKYADVNTSDTTKTDSLATKVENENPYRRILSDSYQDSYERRLRGIEDPRYGSENFTSRYSDDYFYASAYDPALYNTVIMGNQIWVEPWYISAMFSWPNYHRGFRFGFGWTYNYWNDWSPWYSNYYNPWYNNFWDYGFYNPYYAYNNWFTGDSYYWNNQYYTNHNEHYGRRTGGSTTNTSPNLRSGISYENQIISDRRRNGSTSESTINGGVRNNANIRSRNNTQGTNYGNGQRNNAQEVTRRNNRIGDYNTARLRNDGTYRNNERTEVTRRNNGIGNQENNTRIRNTNGTLNRTESTRRNNDFGNQGNYQRPRSANNDYIRPNSRNQNTEGISNRGINSRNSSTVREGGRSTTPTYNSPNRVSTSTPSGSRERISSGNESSFSRPSSSGGGNSSSGSSNNSSSGSSSSSSSGGGERRR
ncbi:MAG: hypothetical protein HXX16_17375 [Bacteroidales bacterium]|nr:hypothetical protein [Bacteroidales bacterium]